jgi:hypothetical protein
MNSSTPEFQLDGRPPVFTSLSAVTVADATSSFQKLYIRRRCPRILSSSNRHLFHLPLLVIDPGNTQLRAGHGEASIFHTHLSGLSYPPLDPPSSSTCATTAQAPCSMIEGLSLAGIEGGWRKCSGSLPSARCRNECASPSRVALESVLDIVYAVYTPPRPARR